MNKTPTWINKRVGDDRVSNILDRFLFYEGVLNDYIRVRNWVGLGGDSDLC
jgi:hypothetical protein